MGYRRGMESEATRRSAELELALEKALMASAAKSAFLANMSHEIRTPMTAVLGYADLILDAELSREDLAEYAGIIKSNGEHLLQILNEVLDLSRIEAGELVIEHIDFDLPQMIQGIVSTMRIRAAERGITLVVDYEGEVPGIIRGDPTRLRQILVNLVGNAIKFTREGKVGIVTRRKPGSDGNTLQVRVEDSGIGIRPEEMATIFEPFTQGDSSTARKYGGTGLGLSISRRLARALGGDIRATSRLGEGSVFELSFALAPSHGIPHPAPEKETPAP
ncbi:MAG: ATP-binding protein [Gemmatimonadota bacterium]|nr:ATP-binding protein [Gemmatimonadota bacterium]MDP7031648.1 ATP-binding protein [Gemmatimonadota bacterium]